ncbi:MAG: adenylyltransferase/cytidyltransferase family protein [Nanoarchaeota archaeon]
MIELNSEAYQSENILSEEELLPKLDRLKKEGKKIGLCTGSFDLLHPGHITHLNSAKKVCDILVVAVAPDSFTSANKSGKGRPVFSHDIRSFMVSQLKFVDFVIIDKWLPEPGVLSVIKPDIFVKGADYSDEKDPRIVRQRKIVESHGGAIHYTQDEKLSTSDILKYIKTEINLS